ncbi:phage major tropism determinant [Desulfonatronovibrio hydrogenovorans]|uniref:phage major tropism determinant n=1 Tax=Desulfonatronovibrio hydrogenovorans TaxID=53245 RepID=UPI000491AFD4|nr:hypothetical protein [Desulfonatronovibrio hydrogenovorans]
MSKVYAIPATGAGHIELMGRVKKGAGSTLDIPEGLVNIGGNGKGFILQAQNGFDPLAHDDGSVVSLEVGDDIYVYAVWPDDDGPICQLKTSRNTTWPGGYNADNSRRLAGFHYGRYRLLEHRYQAGEAAQEGIIPNSVWDLLHRPKCEPTGMVEIIEGSVWMDIYLNSVDGASWPETKGESKINAQPVNCNDVARWDFFRLARNAGKRLPTLGEMYIAAYGVPQGATGAGGRVNTGVHTDYGFDCVSCLGLDQPSGNLWQFLDDGADDQGSYQGANQGQDSAHNHGQARMRHSIFGGYWTNSSEAGARCATNSLPWNQGGGYGFRGACDSL